MNKIIHVCKIFLTEMLRLLGWLLRYRKSSKAEPGSNRGKKVVVVGNGPSAKEFPYQKYIDQGYDFCCVNYFATDEERFFSLKPKFYCCVDPGLVIPKTESDRRLVSALERVDWELNFICYADEHLTVNNKHIKYRFINRNLFEGKLNALKKRLYAKNKATCGFQNVIIAAEYYFIMSNASHVILTGVENDWHRELVVDENCEVYRECVYFYGKERYYVTREGDIQKGELYKYFEWYAMTLRQHASMAAFAEANGVRIENACLPSYIDVFPKICV